MRALSLAAHKRRISAARDFDNIKDKSNNWFWTTGGVAQLGERVLCKHEVGSSNLLASTNFCKAKIDPERPLYLVVCHE